MKICVWKGLLLLIAAASTVLAQGPRVHLIHLDPHPEINGGCPARLHFTGHIEATGPMEVQYAWVRSDGSQTEHTLRFARATSLNVSTNWSIDRRYSGWMQLVILSPSRMQTARSTFHVDCGR